MYLSGQCPAGTAETTAQVYLAGSTGFGVRLCVPNADSLALDGMGHLHVVISTGALA
ncbi:MAG: hypothetical protein HOH43_14330 [Candidatus Latescibacteria bacterium]|nr:hypothetical protein [Candidatus Latescibacterota bacterium]